MSLDYTAREALDRVLADFQRKLHTAFAARVTRYYPDLGTVDVEPAVMREVPGEEHEPDEYEDMGELVNLPVAWPRGSGFSMTWPLSPGDWVLVVCSEQSHLGWRVKGEPHSHPALNDPHGLNGCFVIPAAGAYPDMERIRNVNTTDLVIGREDGSSTIRMKPTGQVEIDSPGLTVGPGAVANRQSATKDKALHDYLTLVIQAVGAAIAGVPAAGGGLKTAFDAALLTPPVLAAKAATASPVLKTE